MSLNMNINLYNQMREQRRQDSIMKLKPVLEYRTPEQRMSSSTKKLRNSLSPFWQNSNSKGRKRNVDCMKKSKSDFNLSPSFPSKTDANNSSLKKGNIISMNEFISNLRKLELEKQQNSFKNFNSISNISEDTMIKILSGSTSRKPSFVFEKEFTLNLNSTENPNPINNQNNNNSIKNPKQTYFKPAYSNYHENACTNNASKQMKESEFEDLVSFGNHTNENVRNSIGTSVSANSSPIMGYHNYHFQNRNKSHHQNSSSDQNTNTPNLFKSENEIPNPILHSDFQFMKEHNKLSQRHSTKTVKNLKSQKKANEFDVKNGNYENNGYLRNENLNESDEEAGCDKKFINILDSAISYFDKENLMKEGESNVRNSLTQNFHNPYIANTNNSTNQRLLINFEAKVFQENEELRHENKILKQNLQNMENIQRLMQKQISQIKKKRNKFLYVRFLFVFGFECLLIVD